MFSNSKRGQGIQDLAALIVVPFALAIIFAVVALTFDDVNASWQNMSTATNTSKDVVSDNEGKFVSVLDNGFMILFVGLILAGVTGLFLIDTHPIIFIMVAIGFIALFLVAGMMANSWSDVTETGELSTFTDEFTFMPLVMENLFPTAIIVAGIFGVAFFAKIRRGG